MKIAPKAIESFLRQPGPEVAAALFYGPDQGLVRARAKRLAAHFVHDLADAFNYAEISEERLKSEPTCLAEEMAALSFTGGQRAVLVRSAGDKHAETIAEAVAGRSPRTFLVVCAEELTPRSALRAMFEKEPMLAALACYHDEAQDVGALLRARLEQERITAPREVVEFVVQQLGNDRMVTQSEVEKLALFAGPGGRLSLADAQAVICGNRLAETDDLAYALALGDLPRAEKLYQQLLREGAQPIMLLRGIARQFQRFYAARLEIEQGKRVEDAVSVMRPAVFFRDVPPVTRILQRWNGAAIRRALEWLNEAELAGKTQPVSPALLMSRAFYRIGLLNPAAQAA